MTKHIVTREIRDSKIRELARVYLSRAVTTRWIPGALARARLSSSIQLKFCIDAPSKVRYHELINYRRRYGRP